VAPNLDNFGSYHELSVRNRCHGPFNFSTCTDLPCGDVIEL